MVSLRHVVVISPGGGSPHQPVTMADEDSLIFRRWLPTVQNQQARRALSGCRLVEVLNGTELSYAATGGGIVTAACAGITRHAAVVTTIFSSATEGRSTSNLTHCS